MLETPLVEMLGIGYPIIQAGMGPWSTERLCIASADAGILGVVSTVGLAYKIAVPSALEDGADVWDRTPYELLRMTLDSVGEKTAESGGIFGVNIPLAQEFAELIEGLFKATTDARKDPDIARRLKVIITSAGNPTPWSGTIRESGALWFHVAPSVYHARKAEQAGADLVIASGREGGGHVAFEPVHTMTLLPAVVDAVDLPVVGAGGFCDGRGLVAALCLGAVGVQMGTRFIATRESDFQPMWKDKVLEAGTDGSVVGISVFGPARYLKNGVSLRLGELLQKGFEEGYQEGVDLETRGIELSMAGEEPDRAVFFGGEVAGRIDGVPTVEEVVAEIAREAEEVAAAVLEPGGRR
ncbi:MAG: nitronate monooxygenase [Actinobacteria bacterium]|nr:nitronate monooxygenase [Actinomycetota bacterium]MBU1945036.1 nitronate monooxygenase [Actinomycetota bacterium]MBU2686628.1 nitronate monooxygenase [Actinomycetota bacterium]